MSRLQRIVHLVLRVLLCALFLFSAIAKLLAIDHFELYIYSYGLLPLGASYVAARLCIGAELVLALLIAIGRYPRFTRLATVGLLLAFSLVLCYAILVGRTESCQCFGKAVEMRPAASLLKNALLVVLALLCFRWQPAPKPARRPWLRLLLVVLASVALAVAPFVVSVPDNWAFGSSHEPYNATLFGQQLEPEGTLHGLKLDQGSYVVAFVTPGCPYCALAHQKLDAIAERYNLPQGSIVYVEPADIGNTLFLNITYGARPLVLLLEQGKVTHTYHYRNISEREVAQALGQKGG